MYADSVRITIRDVPYGEDAVTEALVAHFKEVGVDAQLEETAEEVQRWLVAEGLIGYEIETRHRTGHIGASFVSAEIIITFVSGVASRAVYDALLHLVKERLALGKRLTTDADWLRRLDPDEASESLHGTLARVLERPRADFRPQELVRDKKKVEAAFETVTGEVYRIRVSSSGDYRVSKVSSARGGTLPHPGP